MPQVNKEKIAAGAEMAHANYKKTMGAAGAILGAVLDHNQVQAGFVDTVNVIDTWTATWGKHLPPHQHPVRDALFAEGHDLTHTLSQEGVAGIAGALLIIAGIASVAQGSIESHFARERFRNS